MLIQIDKTNRISINDQIKDQIKGLIFAGQFSAGDQLPTIRELSTALAVNFNTVALAYRDLVNEGVIQTQRGVGTFIATTPEEKILQRIHTEKLYGLVDSFMLETTRLGYSPKEVWEVVEDKLNPGS
jgi:GntR family transcriptional regulator